MSLERNTLMEEVYPKIKIYCKEKHGLEFQVVDMRWGVRDEATDDHMTTQLCMNELRNCQRLSVGPNFVTFLGQKYGYRPIPTYIVGAEFQLLCNALVELDISEVELLYLWYREDTNAVPSNYILQPISSILKHFNNKVFACATFLISKRKNHSTERARIDVKRSRCLVVNFSEAAKNIAHCCLSFIRQRINDG